MSSAARKIHPFLQQSGEFVLFYWLPCLGCVVKFPSMFHTFSFNFKRGFDRSFVTTQLLPVIGLIIVIVRQRRNPGGGDHGLHREGWGGCFAVKRRRRGWVTNYRVASLPSDRRNSSSIIPIFLYGSSSLPARQFRTWKGPLVK